MSVESLRVLIVEDQFLIAKQLEAIILSAGHTVVGTATTSDTAHELVTTAAPDLVFLDISLDDGPTGTEIAAHIAKTSTAQVIFTTANRRRIPTDFCGAIGVVEKPFTRAGLLSAMNFVVGRLRNNLESMIQPKTIQLSPEYGARWKQG